MFGRLAALAAAGSWLAGIAFGCDSADVFREAISLFVGEGEVEGGVFEAGCSQLHVGEAGHAVFDFDGKGLGGNDGGAVF